MQASGDAPKRIVTPATPIPGVVGSLFPSGSPILSSINNLMSTK